jgi:hypothetical protein
MVGVFIRKLTSFDFFDILAYLTLSSPLHFLLLLAAV